MPKIPKAGDTENTVALLAAVFVIVNVYAVPVVYVYELKADRTGRVSFTVIVKV